MRKYSRIEMMRLISRLIAAAKRSPDLLKPEYRRKVDNGANPLTGHCYVISEIIARHFGLSDLKPMVVRHEGGTHWFLLHKDEAVIDPTAAQFSSPVPYHQAKGCGFLTKKPSRRAVELAKRAGIKIGIQTREKSDFGGSYKYA